METIRDAALPGGIETIREGGVHRWLTAAAAAAIEMVPENPSSDTMLRNILKNIPPSLLTKVVVYLYKGNYPN